MVLMWWTCWILLGAFATAVMVYLSVLMRGDEPMVLKSDVKLSVLVAARNEEAAILDCLKALHGLDYPIDNIEILIGDDASTDRTAEIIQAFIEDKPQFNYFLIQGTLNGLRGKQNVLAQLGQKASGDLLLITDADIRVNPLWAQGMAGAFADKQTGIVCGPSIVWGDSLFAKVQGLDWMMGQVLSFAHVRLGIPISAVGNNMAIRTEAYRKLGGYESLPFHIIEDYQLFQGLCERGGWRYRLLLHPTVGAVSLPLENLKAWFHQRRRWFAGARSLAWYNLALICLNASFLPAIVCMWVYGGPVWGIACLTFKLASDFALLSAAATRLGMSDRLRWFGPYSLYYLFSLIATPMLMVLPGKVVWKGRKYEMGGR
jgi:cellulose synthase/poly-beta-1,6-N-acetylglucosamine synthase-like glycosyltransferase